MIDLDTRARQAAAGLKDRVASTEFALATPPADRAPMGLHPVWSLVGGAMTALILLIGIWMVRPTLVADEVDEIVVPTTAAPTTEAPTTAPATFPPVSPASNEDEPTSTTVVVDVTAPFLEITSPSDGQVFEKSTIVFEGTTEPGARVYAGPYEATVDTDGKWSIVLILSPGTNKATFVAVDDAGNESTASVSPVYEPPVTTTTKPKEEKAAFTANFTFGECSESPPYDVYYGKGEPGSKVFVTSEFGGGETVVDAEGHWELRVEFPEAPTGKVFAVKAKDSFGRSKTFEFVNTGD